MAVAAKPAKTFTKNEKIFEGASRDWYITPDDNHLEFVTLPFEQEGDAPERQRMQATVTGMADAFRLLHLIAAFDGEQKETFLSAALDDEGTALANVLVDRSLTLYPPVAAPQATGGISLESVTSLYDKLVTQNLKLQSAANEVDVQLGIDDPEPRTSASLFAAANPARDAKILMDAKALAETYVSGVPASSAHELRGFLTLVFTYLLAGERQSGQHPQAKYFLPLMTRMSFSAMYATLPPEAQAEFDPVRVLHTAGLAASEHVYKHGFAEGSEPVSKGPRRDEWLASIALGHTDAMSFGGGTDVTAGKEASSPAMGQYDRLDPGHRGGAPGLVQIELRRLPRQVPPSEWLAVAETIFDAWAAVTNADSTTSSTPPGSQT